MLAVDARALLREALEEAVAVLRGGGLVAFPTESFYGLGADALNPQALTRVFSVKGRPESKPLLVLVASPAMAETLVSEIGDGPRALMARHWPGPLTLVLRAAPGVPSALTAGTGTVGLRMPGHPIALDLVRAAGFPVTAPSANPAGQAAPTTARMVREYFEGGGIDLVLDGGPTAGGPPSTVADCTVWPPRVLRQGPVSV
ncbi:MAG TPA: L-threonylcarbamoyladenylate synthase [Methylomirabilota bacterium]|jgi:L-threonylcarbamoyladenylate synthase|nr:L-threonylcarbamoyladenylate synthase [Methylomirabilota bacterium]